MRPNLTWCLLHTVPFVHVVVVASRMITAFRSLGVGGWLVWGCRGGGEGEGNKEQQGVSFSPSP